MSTQKNHHLAARMGHWSARHRKKAIFGWFGFVIVAFALGNFVFTQKTIVYETSEPGESGRAETILYEDFEQPAGETVLIQNSELVATEPEFKAVVEDVIKRVGSLAAIAKVESPFDEENLGQISGDKHSVIVEMEIAGESDKAIDKIDPVVDRDRRGAERAPRLLHRLGRREHQQGRHGRLHRRPGEGRALLDSADPDHPHRRVRRARRGRHPARARTERGARRRSAWSPFGASCFRWRRPSAR